MSASIDTPDWVRNAVFYQIFPDRFARSGKVAVGGPLESWDAPPTSHGFKGGDLPAIVDRLGYLQELGITAIYFCPIFASASNHRYHTYDYFQVDPLLGGNDALKELLLQAHARDIRVVLDGVFNHASRGFWQFHHVLENGAGSPYTDWFHFDPSRLTGQRPFQAYPSDSAVETLAAGAGSLEAVGYAAWWNLPALPKFNTSCPEAREFLMTVGEHWMRFGIDGWRLDVPNEIEDDEFWREFRQRIRDINPEAYIVGEVWGDARHWLKGDMWDATMNYQITAACMGFFGGDHLDLEEARRPSSFSHVRPLTAAEFHTEIQKLTTVYPPEITAVQLNLLDSHDMPRFLTCCGGDRTAQKMAWLFVCLLPGAPCIYYGDEIAMEGRHDPDCRRSFPWSEDEWDQDMRAWYQLCIALRASHPIPTAAPTLVSDAGDAVVVFHSPGESPLVTVFNTGDTDEQRPIDTSLIRTGAIRLTSSSGSILQSEDGGLKLTIGPRSAVVIE